MTYAVCVMVIISSSLFGMGSRSNYSPMPLVLSSLKDGNRFLAERFIGQLDPYMHNVNEAEVTTGDRALHYVARLPWGSAGIRIAGNLLAKGAYINVCNARGNTPLFCAVYAGRMSMARFLIENGADPEISNLMGHTPLHALLSTAKYVRCMNEEIHNCNDAFNIATCKNKILNCFTLLTMKRCPSLKETCMTWLARNRSISQLTDEVKILPMEVATPLLFKRLQLPDIAHDEDEVLFSSLTKHRLVDLAETLKGERPLLNLVLNSSDEVLGETVLHHAAAQGACFEILERLVQMGAARTLRNTHNETPALLLNAFSCSCQACINFEQLIEAKQMLMYPNVAYGNILIELAYKIAIKKKYRKKQDRSEIQELQKEPNEVESHNSST